MSLYNTYGIYGIKNNITNFVYIGKTINSFGDRRDCHFAQLRGGYNGNKPLQRDWNNFGEDNFTFFVIRDLTGQDLDTVNFFEMLEILKFKKLGLAYNLHDGGDEAYNKGKHLSEETKKKIGEKNKVNMIGKKATQETKNKMSKSQRARWEKLSDEEKEEWSKMLKEVFKEKPMSSEAREKISKKLKGNKNGASLTIEEVKKIRYLHEVENKTYKEISEIMKIPKPNVYNIATYRRWADVE